MNYKIAIIIVLPFLLSACSSVDSLKVFDSQQAANFLQQNHKPQPARQIIKMSLPQKEQWTRIDLSFGTVGSPVMLIPKTETLTTWNQSIRTFISPFINGNKSTANQCVQNAILTSKKSCQSVAIKTFLQPDKIIFYYLDKTNCKGEKDQLQIGKVFTGQDAIYGVYYTAKKGVVSDADINKLSRVIKAAQLISNPRY